MKKQSVNVSVLVFLALRRATMRPDSTTL